MLSLYPLRIEKESNANSSSYLNLVVPFPDATERISGQLIRADGRNQAPEPIDNDISKV